MDGFFIYIEKKEIFMAKSIRKKEALLMKKQFGENEILRQIAALLVREKLLNSEEHLRFLSLLKEDS